jgi:hypothetical protein
LLGVYQPPIGGFLLFGSLSRAEANSIDEICLQSAYIESKSP